MRLPNHERAVIAPEKLTTYLLNTAHRRGGPKARLLAEFGYNQEKWELLAEDIRRFHLTADAVETHVTVYGVRYEISAPMRTPNGRSLNVRSIWQIDAGTDIPRLITLVPD